MAYARYYRKSSELQHSWVGGRSRRSSSCLLGMRVRRKASYLGWVIMIVVMAMKIMLRMMMKRMIIMAVLVVVAFQTI